MIIRIKHSTKQYLCRKCDKPIDNHGKHCLCADCFATLTRYRNLFGITKGERRFETDYQPDKWRIGAIKI